MCENVFPCFWSSCARLGRCYRWWGKRLKQPVAPRISRRGVFIQRVKPPPVCGQKSKHHPRAAGALIWASRPRPVTAPSFLGLFASRRELRSKAADRIMRDAYATFPCPVQTPSGDSRARWVTLQGLVGGCCGWKVQPKSSAWDRIWTIILSSSILLLMT